MTGKLSTLIRLLVSRSRKLLQYRALGALIFCFVGNLSNANQQIIEARLLELDAPDETSVRVALAYATKPVQIGTTGLGIHLFYNKKAASIIAVKPNPDLDGLFLPAGNVQDIQDLDQDPSTNYRTTFAWVNPTPSNPAKGHHGWPGFEERAEELLVAELEIEWTGTQGHQQSVFNILLDTASGFEGLAKNFSIDFSTKPYSTTLSAGLSSTPLSDAALASTGGATDSDQDGLDDEYENLQGFDPYDAEDASGDADGDGRSNLDEYLMGSDPHSDDVPPTVYAPSDLKLDASGRLTTIDLGVASAVDGLDGALNPSPNFQGPFQPGRHEIIWSATDAAGNQGTASQIILVNPLAGIAPMGRLSEGTSLEVEILLNGQAPSYPVTFSLEFSGTATPDVDYRLSSSEVVIFEGTRGSITLEALPDNQDENSESVTVILGAPADHAALGPNIQATYRIEDGPVPPALKLEISQNNRMGRKVSLSEGMTKAKVLIQDPNGSHTISWNESSSTIIAASVATDTGLEIDTGNLAPGKYDITAIVSDNELPGERFKVGSTLIVDSAEVSADSDGDGIPDSLEVNSEQNLIPLDASLGTQQASADAGVVIVVGDAALESGTAGILISEETLIETTGSEDSEYDYPSGMFDFEIQDLPIPGESIRLTIPLSQAIPADAVFRKYAKDTGWQDFVFDADNLIASANGIDGACPELGDAAYTTGLTEGALCIQLTLQDGGPNDADGEINGVYQDPSGIAQRVDSGNSPTPPASSTNNSAGVTESATDSSPKGGKSGGGGCTVSSGQADWGLVLLLLMAIARWVWLINRRHLRADQGRGF